MLDLMLAPGELSFSLRSIFARGISTPMDAVRITEDSLYVRQRTESGKRVCVRQPAELASLGHPCVFHASVNRVSTGW